MQKKQIIFSLIIIASIFSIALVSLYILKESRKNSDKNITTSTEISKKKTLEELTLNTASNCGYEYFIKKMDGSYEYLPEEIFNLRSENSEIWVKGDASSTKYFNFINSMSYIIPDDVVSKLLKSTSSSYSDGVNDYRSSHPQDTLSVALYTSGCLNATNTPKEYYTPNNVQLIKTDTQNDPELVAVIHKADTVEQLEKYIFEKNVNLKGCHLMPTFNDAGIVSYGAPSYCGSFGYYKQLLQNKNVAPRSFIEYVKPTEVPYWSETIIVN